MNKEQFMSLIVKANDPAKGDPEKAEEAATALADLNKFYDDNEKEFNNLHDKIKDDNMRITKLALRLGSDVSVKPEKTEEELDAENAKKVLDDIKY